MARKSSGKPDSGMAKPSVRQGKPAGQRLATPPADGTAVQSTGRAGPAQSARNPRTKPGQSADAAGWSDADRAAFVRDVLLAGPHGPELRAALAEQARWSDVLGDDLARRVGLACLAAGEDPADWCRRQLADAVGVLERKAARRAENDRARARCAHPERDRRGNRCGACGTRGLPAVS